MNWLREAGLKQNPYDLPINDYDDVFVSQDLENVQQEVAECLSGKLLTVIVGPPGAGKSTAVNEQLNEAKHTRGKPITAVLPGDYTINFERLRCGHFEEALLRKLIEAGRISERMVGRANARTHQLRRLLGQHAERHDVLLVIDDAHALAHTVLKELKRLRELKWAMKERLLSIILLAHPQFEMDLKDVKEVDDRARLFRMSGLSAEEVAEYIRFKFARVGAGWSDYISPAAVKIVAGATRWPLEINKLMTTLLRNAVEIGELPISKALAEKHCVTVTSLAGLKAMSGLTTPEIRMILRTEYKLDVSTDTIKRILAGGDSVQPGVKEAIRKALTPLADSHAPQIEQIRTSLNDRQKLLMDRIFVMLQEFDYEFDFEELAATADIRRNRFYQILFEGRDPNEGELIKIERAVKQAHTEKKKRAA